MRRTGKVNTLLGMFACSLSLTGCATSERTQPTIVQDVPTTFASPSPAGAVEDQWWKRFGDTRLNALVDKAVADNPSIGKAIARVKQAQAQARIAGADRLPQLGVGLNASKQQQTLASLGIALPGTGQANNQSSFTIENYQLSANVSWEIDLWGKLSAQSAAARTEFLASKDNLRGVRQTIAAQTVRSYFAVIEAQQQVSLSEDIVKTYAETARQIGNRVQYGKSSPNDGFLAKANLRSAEADLEQRKQNFERATRQLDILTRDYPDGTVDVASALPAVPPAPPAGLPAQLLERRPDIAAAERSLKAAGYRLTAAERSFLPSIELTGLAGTSSTSLANIFDPAFFIWSIAGQLLQPVFQGGRLRAQVELRDGERDEALEDFADTVLTALSEVETALAIEQNLARQETALAAAAADAQRAAEIAFNRYYVGSDPFLNVLEGQQRAFDAKSAYLTTRKARFDNRIALHLALGGGFENGDVEKP
jgi:multidrug efflux system outer membrane protein|tara:strand:- start:12121 stop:13563 length:1443 start_codon:yes stop_codon:yes gene_type:complete